MHCLPQRSCEQRLDVASSPGCLTTQSHNVTRRFLQHRNIFKCIRCYGVRIKPIFAIENPVVYLTARTAIMFFRRKGEEIPHKTQISKSSY